MSPQTALRMCRASSATCPSSSSKTTQPLCHLLLVLPCLLLCQMLYLPLLCCLNLPCPLLLMQSLLRSAALLVLAFKLRRRLRHSLRYRSSVKLQRSVLSKISSQRR